MEANIPHIYTHIFEETGFNSLVQRENSRILILLKVKKNEKDLDICDCTGEDLIYINGVL